MTFDPNDPRLTAFVLGELDPSERPEFEAILESSSEARQAADEIRQTIGWLTDHLRDEQSAHDEAPRPSSPKCTCAASVGTCMVPITALYSTAFSSTRPTRSSMVCGAVGDASRRRGRRRGNFSK